MLRALHIRNVVLIEQLALDCYAGLTTLTGETGAGKSILLDSLGLSLGARADAGLVRHGADQAVVTAEFSVPLNHPIQSMLESQGLPRASDLLCRRVVSADGRSRAFINDDPVSVSFLKSIGDQLIDIHGQFETYGLLDPASHRAILDDYAAAPAFLEKVSVAWDAWRAAVRVHEDAIRKAREAAAQEVYLRQALKDIDEADPQPGEEASLTEARHRLQNKEQLVAAIVEAQQILSADEGVDSLIGRAWKNLHRLRDKFGEGINPVLDALDRASAAVQDADHGLSAILSPLEESGVSLEEIEDRLYTLRALARRNNCLIDDLPGLADDLRQRVGLVDDQEKILFGLHRAAEEAKATYVNLALDLRRQREKVARILDKAVNAELPALKLDKAVFATVFTYLSPEDGGPAGLDQVQFMVTTNAGSVAGPINKIASGGEMARFMLALKVVLAERAGLSRTYVFDEIDTGIGGETAAAVGERLARLARRHQVMVVTHSPQVAARADHHWVVSKSTSGKAVRTSVTALEGDDQRREEIARMLSGANVTAEARAAADKLLERGVAA